MKCAVYHTHKWGGQPGLYNAMVSAVVPRQDEDQFQDLQVNLLKIIYTKILMFASKITNLEKIQYFLLTLFNFLVSNYITLT